MTSKYDRAKGQVMFDEVYCKDLGELPPPGTSKFIDYMLETLFAELWADGTLSIRDRRLLLLGAIAAQGDEATMAIQARSALKRGELNPEQLEAMAVFLTQYVGYPRGSKVFRVVSEVAAQAKPRKP
jgi:4-carboxymuconolactone decarboxylase